MQRKRVVQSVSQKKMDDRSFRHTDDRSGDLKRLTFSRERLDGDTWLTVAVRIPVAGARLETHRQRSVRERAGRNAIIVHRDTFARTGR
ncbi:MAG TPA: hypothetical protein VEL79_19350 [Vicinamibacterales bacterium]|nr:hypothetical protein [Vicinamibacterales bacterium]